MQKSAPVFPTESHLRSIIKGLTWRILGSCTTAFGAYIISGKVTFALQLGGFDFVAKIVFYYVHERLWLLIPRGTVRQLYLWKRN